MDGRRKQETGMSTDGQPGNKVKTKRREDTLDTDAYSTRELKQVTNHEINTSKGRVATDMHNDTLIHLGRITPQVQVRALIWARKH